MGYLKIGPAAAGGAGLADIKYQPVTFDEGFVYAARFARDGRTIVYDELERHRLFFERSDLRAVDVATGKVRKLTRGLRAREPDVSRDGEEVKLTPLEFDLLVALARKPRQVFTREVLLEQVWGYRHAADTRLVNVHVQRLRAKIEPDPERPEIILTVRGVGYKAGTG